MTKKNLTYYGFDNAVGAFFQMPTDDARGLIPSYLEPMEVQHTRSILAVTCFDFVDSEVGPYHEVVMAVIVPPLVEPDRPLPKAAFYPYMVGTTTEVSRTHAIERWHLPHYMGDLGISMVQDGDRMDVEVRDGGSTVLEMSVTRHDYVPNRTLYNAFMCAPNDERKYKANIYMEGPYSEHEEERGSLALYEHEMTVGLTIPDIDTIPFREQWYLAGRQTFEPLIEI